MIAASALAIFLLGAGAGSEEQARPAARIAYLVTVGPGREIWERFGHNAIWIHDPGALPGRTDLAYDYGRFDFRAERFFLRFALGDMEYSMDTATVTRIVQGYGARDRSVVIQQLSLTQDQITALQEALDADVARVMSPGGWTYSYDYYLDNCSTRLRDVLDQVLGGAVHQTLSSRATGTTFREHSLRSVTNNVGVYLGLDLLLGPDTDRPISAWEAAFLPQELQRFLRVVTVAAGDSAGPLVVAEQEVVGASRYEVPDQPPRWGRWFLLGGILLGGLMVHAATTGHRRLFFGLAGLWALIAAVAGLVLIALWTVSTHRVAYGNANLFQVNLLGLVLLGLFPGMVRGGNRALGAGRATAAMAAGVAVLGAVLSLSGLLAQPAGPVTAVAVPLWLGVALGLRRLSER